MTQNENLSIKKFRDIIGKMFKEGNKIKDLVIVCNEETLEIIKKMYIDIGKEFNNSIDGVEIKVDNVCEYTYIMNKNDNK